MNRHSSSTSREASGIAPPSAASKPTGSRLVSLDIFRGLNLALMIFVNELAEIKGLPWWTYHAPAKVDVMTYVDMVFPGFLVIVGMSLPLALNARVRRGDGFAKLAWYIVLRAAALIVLGLILANGSEGDAAQMHGVGTFLWALLALLGAFLIWLDYPKTENRERKRMFNGLRVVGFLLLCVLAILYRRQHGSGAALGLSYGYPEILGLIGYTYFVTAFCYLLTRRHRWAPVGWFVAFLALNVATTAKWIPMQLPWWKWPPQNGSMGALVFAGIVLTMIFLLEPRLESFRKKAIAAILLGFAAALLAWLLHPLGISKIRATPTWVLYTVAACCGVYTLLYWICEVNGRTKWALPVWPAGSNTLLTYLLPDLWYYISGFLGFEWWNAHFNYGVSGVFRALVFTAMMLAISALLTRMRLRLQL